LKKLFLAALVTVVALSVFGAGASASSLDPAIGPYEGAFEGYVFGDRSSRALLTLVLTHRDGVVSGIATLGEGLYINAGRCGGGRLPASEQVIAGQSMPRNSRQIQAESTFKVGSFDIGVELQSDLSLNGETLTAEARIDIPWICGRDPVLDGTLYRVP